MTHSTRIEPAKKLLLIIAASSTVLHIYSSIFAHYGIFRDELYYIACAENPAFGYVDQPPLSIWILSLIISLFGKSLFVIRLLPALLAGASIYVAGLTTLHLGGKKLAVMLVALSLLISGIHLSFSSYYSMNVIDLFLWSCSLYLVVRLIQSQQPRFWIYLGIVLGLAALNKVGAVFFGAGFFIALLITKERHWFTTRWPWYAAGIGLIIFSPYIVWNIQHDMAHLEFIHNASSEKYSSQNPWIFWSQQFLINHPYTFPIWICGVVYFLTQKSNSAYRFLFIIFLTVAAIFTINGTSKPEYLAAIFPVMLMGGSLQFEMWSQKYKWIYPTMAVILISGLWIAPFAMPLLPVQQYIAFADTIGIKPESREGKELSELPQFYADMFGWEEKAQAIAAVYHTLPPGDQKKCALFGDNYGRSGAIDYYAGKYDLPKSIGRHNNYWLWGPRQYTGELMLIISADLGDKPELFESVEDMGIIHCKYCMPYENDLHIYLCRNSHIPLPDFWNNLKNYN